MSEEDLFSGFLLDSRFQGRSPGTGLGKADRGLSGPMSGRGVQRCCMAEWPQRSKGKARHRGARHPCGLCGEEVGRGDFATAVFPSSSLPCLPVTRLTRS